MASRRDAGRARGGDLDPSAVATLRPELVAGHRARRRGATGHAAIVARALGIPLVLGLGSALDGGRRDKAVDGAVDGSDGRLLIEPSADDVSSSSGCSRVRPPRARWHRRRRRGGGRAPNGVSIVANVASALEAEAAARAGAEGIGLVRTELLFLGRSTPPTVGEQRSTYARILDVMGGSAGRLPDARCRRRQARRVAVGRRRGQPGARRAWAAPGLRRPDLLDDQFAALLQAAAGRELRVMLPMVATREEVDEARGRLEAVRAGWRPRARRSPRRCSSA